MQVNCRPITERVIRLGLVGVGRVADFHIEAIQNCAEDLQIQAVCDPDQNKGQVAAQKLQARYYQTISDLADDGDIDVVVLCTPSGLHAQQTQLLARAGKHVICEKPMATRWQDGLDMIKACDTYNVQLFVVKQNRYNAPLKLLKQAIQDGRFGQLYLANANVFWRREQAYYEMADWRGTWEFDGGAFMNQASHYIDLLHWLLGPVDCVQALMGTLERNIEAEDTGVVNVRWRHGALGSVNVTNLTYDTDWEGSLTILGEKGTVRIGGKALNHIDHWHFAEPQENQAMLDQANYETDSVYGLGHFDYYKNIVDVFRGRAKPDVDGRSGLKSLELLIAAYRAARDRQTVYLPLAL